MAHDVDLPEPPRTDQFYLEPLGEQHNKSDYAAWTSSIDHIRATPGFAGRDWPRVMQLADNLEDLRKHAEDFRMRRGFTYTVLDPAEGEVIGCVYIYPSRDLSPDVRSWVRADRAELDVPLWQVVSAWLDTEWPFVAVAYADR
ncbi:MAG: twin-arginine translocation pathway signal protein [Candidatus Nephthysia bennettiae]|nr:MAG: twin-arginine translocation pathway signal protein [Candidatus Dormibacteraeota bacterium]